MFREYEIYATWSTVGFLFCESRDELCERRPKVLPRYAPGTDPYEFARGIGKDEKEDPFHFAPSLIGLIRSTPHQEIGSHTFSHMFCLEKGATREAFAADLEAAMDVAGMHGLRLRSLVFPKNQINADCLKECERHGLDCYRSARSHWIYAPRDDRRNRLPIRALRLADTYLPLTDGETSNPLTETSCQPLALGASRFLRPWTRVAAPMDPLRLRRITRGLDEAAERGKVFHLWWHPHNFGLQTAQNIDFLRRVLDHAASLRDENRLLSLNMAELATRVMRRRPGAVEQPEREVVASP